MSSFYLENNAHSEMKALRMIYKSLPTIAVHRQIVGPKLARNDVKTCIDVVHTRTIYNMIIISTYNMIIVWCIQEMVSFTRCTFGISRERYYS